jgi:purine-binding chemotaxis protein CheW
MSDLRQLTTFFLRGLYFGIDVRKVQEVIRCQPMTRVPTAPTVVSGLINLRGQIVTALDLRQRLALDGDGAPEAPINVVVSRRVPWSAASDNPSRRMT